MSKILLHGAWVAAEKDDGAQVLIKDGYVGVTDDKISYVGKDKPAGYEEAEIMTENTAHYAGTCKYS